MAKSLQDRLKQGRSSNFVGREQQLELFRQNLRRSLDSEDYYFIFSVHGQGGVGKTTLLKKYRSLAKEADALTAYTNEETKSIPEVLARFAQQLKEQDAELTDFDKRYKTYLQEKKRLEDDPEAPKGAWQLGGRLIARSSKRLAKEFIPGSGFFLDGMDADAIGDQMGEWASFVKKRLTNKDEVQLLLQPVETLTPLFLEGLEKHAKNYRICLCFDTYEETDLYLDEWLRHLLEGQYGDAPENLLFVIAGREPLNPNAWSEYGDFIATIPLEAFSELEARTYLEQKKITDKAVVDSILGLSGRLPVLLATLAEAAKHATGDLTDPCATAVERFLKWIDDPVQRDLALHAALPRKLNQDIIQCLLPEGADAKALFQWLSTQPFVQKHQGGYWIYHNTVRELMQRHQFQLSVNTWTDIHRRLAGLYNNRASTLEIKEREKQFSNAMWLGFTLEKTYHQLHASYQKELQNAVTNFITAFRINGLGIADTWAEIFEETGQIWGTTDFGELVVQGVKHSKDQQYSDALNLFYTLIQGFEQKEKLDTAWLYFVLGFLEAKAEDFSKAIEHYKKSIELNPKSGQVYNNLANTLRKTGQSDEAVENFQEAIKINPKHTRAYWNLGETLLEQEKISEAIKYFHKAIKSNQQYEHLYFNIGNILFEKKRFKKAIENYLKAIELDPKNAAAHFNIALAEEKQRNIDEAIKYYQIATEVDPMFAKAFYSLANTLKSRGHLDKAIEYYEKANKIDAKYTVQYKEIGYRYLKNDETDKAIKTLQKALEANPDDSQSYNILGCLYLAKGYLNKAELTFQKAFRAKEENALLHMNYAHCLLAEQKQEEAMDHYRQSRNDFEDKTEFFEGLKADYTDFNLAQYNISKTEYFTLIQQLKDEINYTE